MQGGGLQEKLDRALGDLEEAQRLKKEAEDVLRGKEKEVGDMAGRLKGAEHENKKLEEKNEHLQDQVEFWDAEGKKLLSDADAAKERIEELEAVSGLCSPRLFEHCFEQQMLQPGGSHA
mmetsp:Transcript_33880/g.85662  ORF Transcript_33880/g.85662 Transcript_33880/m.85662 type:complete len:119 (+) Transcript_33880:34-390(+)